tara:strand:+ start:232 stop:711 length:480 start_codon:yes stop_codon:yes gene_type:complete
MKILRNYFYILLFIPLLFNSCSDDSDEPLPIIGCTDPLAVNYNPDADQQGVECLYSLVGDWTAYKFIFDGQDVLPVYTYVDIHFYDDSTFYLEAELLDGTLIQTTGIASLDDETNTLTLVPDNGGATENWNLTYFDGEYVFMNLTDESGFFYDTEWVKY